MVEALCAWDPSFVKNPGREPLRRTGPGHDQAQGLNSVFNFFFTATPLMVAYSGRPFLYGG